MDKSILCYVNGNWAYFTTQSLNEQWGDDWNDAPYEHNAGEPYEYYENDKKAGIEPWEIIKVAWDGNLVTPSEGCINSDWSVEKINSGAIAWLRSPNWSKDTVVIHAGTTLEDFCELVKKAGGNVYLKKD